MSACRSCGARVTWLMTAVGKRIPVDEDPVANGNIVVDQGLLCSVFRDAATAEQFCPGEPRYLPHWATCPDAPTWRRRP